MRWLPALLASCGPLKLDLGDDTSASSRSEGDQDGDGFSPAEGDCDDGNPTMHPDAAESCDGVDNDCDGETDEGAGQVWFVDADGDGYGDAADSLSACDHPGSGYTLTAGDCDDGDAHAFPGASPGCDGSDRDCDGHVDSDGDGDGFADAACGGDDCADGDADLHPDADGLCALGRSCLDILDSGRGEEDGTYLIDPDGLGRGAAPFSVHCDMTKNGGGWTRLAQVRDPTYIKSAFYTDGEGTLSSDNYAFACDRFSSLGDRPVIRLVMGTVTDYFRPDAESDLCEMLSGHSHHQFSASPEGTFVTPSYYGAHLGGSAAWWPDDGRAYLSFWGSESAVGGCCHDSYGSSAAWSRTFTIDLREP